jgi:hypothetical protein
MNESGTELAGRAGRFWTWFATKERRIAALLESYEAATVAEINEHVTGLRPGLQWEIGPGEHASTMFAISPSRERSNLAITRQIVRAAPVLPNWELLPAKPRKRWKQRIHIEGAREIVDCSGWKYILTAFSNREFFDVTLVPFGSEMCDDKLLAEAALLLVEGELGEEMFIEKIGAVSVEKHVPSRREKDLTPIQRLARHIDKLTSEELPENSRQEG